MIIRAADAAVHNLIANHSDVSAKLWSIMPSATVGELDFSKCFQSNDKYILLHNEEQTAAMIFDWTKDNMWDTHSLFLPEVRGRDAIRFARLMGSYMFEKENAEILWGYGLIADKAARWFFRQIGGHSKGFGNHPIYGEVEYFEQTRAQWIELHTK